MADEHSAAYWKEKTEAAINDFGKIVEASSPLYKYMTPESYAGLLYRVEQEISRCDKKYVEARERER